MESIVKFEFALEKHHKKLKSKASGFYFPLDKKYEMDDEEAFDDYQTNMILNNARLYNTEEKKNFNASMQDIMNFRTELFSGTSEPHTKEKLPENTDEDEEEMLVDVLDKYNKIIFYNEEQKLKLGKQNIITKTKSAMDFSKNDLDEHFSNISPLLTYSQKKNKKLKNTGQGQIKNDLITQLSRIDSFSLPRTASKIKMYKFENDKNK
jgi:hypothetical protein